VGTALPRLCPPYETVSLFPIERQADVILSADRFAGGNDG
jgi:hypothetical protein